MKLDSKVLISDYKNKLIKALDFISDEKISQIIEVLFNLKERNGTLYICGNGGSAANAEHLANDFLFGVSPNGNALKVDALNSNTSVLTCLANDIGYENIYSHQLKVKAQVGDVLLVLSGSGNSANVVNAILEAKKHGLTTISIVGFDGGKCKYFSNICIHTDISDMQISEDIQIVIGHMITQGLKKQLISEV